MAKPLRPKKHKVAPKKVVEEDKKIVLVGTYKSGQLEKWPGYYNYPICDGDKIELEFAKKVNEIWLFNAKKEPICLKAEFVGFKTRDELKTEYGYPATGKPHGTGNYILYSTSKTQIYNPASGLAEKVIVRLQDFATSKSVQKKLRDYLDSPDRKDPLLANCLPPLLTKIPSEVLRVCEAAVQMDFTQLMFPERLYPVMSPLVYAKGGIEVTKETCTQAPQVFRMGEFFCGPGGLACGALSAKIEHDGFRIVHAWANDYDAQTCETYRENICRENPETVICGDVRKLDLNDKRLTTIDGFAFGFPCNDFSVVGEHKGIDGNYGPLYQYMEWRS